MKISQHVCRHSPSATRAGRGAGMQALDLALEHVRHLQAASGVARAGRDAAQRVASGLALERGGRHGRAEPIMQAMKGLGALAVAGLAGLDVSRAARRLGFRHEQAPSSSPGLRACCAEAARPGASANAPRRLPPPASPAWCWCRGSPKLQWAQAILIGVMLFAVGALTKRAVRKLSVEQPESRREGGRNE